MASLIFQSFGVESAIDSAMLEMIQEMKFFLRTVYGDSKTFAGSSNEGKSNEVVQLIDHRLPSLLNDVV